MYYTKKLKKKKKKKRKKIRDTWEALFLETVFLALLYFYDKIGSLGCVALFVLAIIICIVKHKLFWHDINKRYLKSGMDEIDTMSGEDFERLLAAHFKKDGYSVDLTPKTKDFGADLILKDRRGKIVVQAKRYSEKVGIKAIQEVVGSKSYYKAKRAMVVTNNYFTGSAQNLALNCGVELWDRNVLINKFNLAEITEFKDSEDYKEGLVCPYCEGSLVKRRSIYGEFYGCSNFPSCKYKKKI